MRTVVLVALAALALSGCAERKAAETRTLTERERDSILATQRLPGAATVGRAMQAGDRAADAAARMNAQVDSLTR
jgi:hypothetical protein